MSWTYSTNMMGPAGLSWYEDNNIPYIVVKYTWDREELDRKVYEQWAGGRIDCYCDDPEDVDYSRYGMELSAHVVPAEQWNRLSDWCDQLRTPRLLSEEELYTRFEEETGVKICRRFI